MIPVQISGCSIPRRQSYRGKGWDVVRGSKRPLSLVAALLLALPAARAQDFDTATHTKQGPETAARAEANAALEARDYTKALKLLTPLAAANATDAHLQYDMASTQDALDQTSPAETNYRAAIAADPNYLEAHLALGLLLARGGRLAEARPELVAATTVPAGEPLLKARAFRTLARIDQKLRPADARDELLEALKLSPETPEDTLLTAELAASAGNGAKPAEAAYRRLLAQQPNDPEASAALAHLLVEQKRPAEAETLLNSALTANPGDPVLTAQLAALLNSEGKAADALPLVQNLHKGHPESTDITHLLASLEAQTGDYAAAEPLYASLSIAAPLDGQLADAHADALIHLKRYAEAQKVLTRAVTQPIQYPTKEDLAASAGHLAFAASENNDPAACLQALTIRATVLPSSPTTLFLAAISQDKLHHIKQAQQAYKDFIAASNGALPDQEFEAQHRLIALQHMH